MMNDHAAASATLRGILATIFWSTTIACSRSLTESLGTFTAAMTIYLLSALVGYITLVLRGGRMRDLRRLSHKYLWRGGGLFVLYTVLLYTAIGLATTDSQVIEVGILNYLWPGLTLLVSVPMLKKRASIFLVPGTVLAFVGAAIALMPDGQLNPQSWLANVQAQPLPYIFALTAAVTWAVYSNGARRWGAASAKTDGADIVLFLFLSGIVLAVLRCFFDEPAQISTTVLGELAYMAVIPTMLAYSFWSVAMRRGHLILVVTVSYCIPLLSTFTSSVYLNVGVGQHIWWGAVLIVAGAVLSKFSVHDSPADETETERENP